MIKLGEHGRIYVLFGLTVITAALGGLSQTAVNVMLAPVSAEFGVGVDMGQWLTTIYMLVFGIVVPLTTYLDRRLSERAYLTCALVLFFAGAMLDAAASSFALLFFGRVLQAVSTGILVPSLQNITMRHFPQNRQGMAMGISGIAMGFAPNIGPTVGSWFVEGFGWRCFFVFLMILAVIGIIATLLFVASEAGALKAQRLDLGSFVLSAIAFGGLLTGLSDAASFGLTHMLTWLPVVVGIVMLCLFIRHARHVEYPLIDMKIFASRRFMIGFWAQNLLFGSFMGITLIIPLYVEGLAAKTAADAGLVLLPAAIVALFCNPLGGIAADRFGQVPVLEVSSIFVVVGAFLCIGFDEATPIWQMALCQGVRAVGISLSIGPLITWTLGGLSGALISHGSSFCTLVRQACAALGTAVMVLLIEVLPAWGISVVWAYHASFAASALACVAMVLVVWVSMARIEREPLPEK